jgi:archaellum component FlaG (FlaF/FlaG flagellin family)
MNRRALSEVISTVILSGVVLVVGGAIWAYSLGATTAIADGYVNDTLSLVNEIVERFDIEHIQYNHDDDNLTIYVYNFGEVDITVDVYVTANATIEKASLGQIISSEQMSPITIDFSSDPLAIGTDVAIKVYSRRQNCAYKSYIVP